MKEFFTSMFSEGGKISHKRVISFLWALAAVFIVVFITVKYPTYVTEAMKWLFVCVLIMSGVATVGQILSIWKNIPEKKDEETKP